VRHLPERHVDFQAILRASRRAVREFMDRWEKGDYCRSCRGYTRHARYCPVGHGAER
jgi:hypothetical protein